MEPVTCGGTCAGETPITPVVILGVSITLVGSYCHSTTRIGCLPGEIIARKYAKNLDELGIPRFVHMMVLSAIVPVMGQVGSTVALLPFVVTSNIYTLRSGA